MIKKIQHVFEAIFLAIALSFFKILPVDMASSVGGWFGRMIGPKLRSSKTAHKNLRQAFPDLPDEEINSIVLGMWDNLGRVFAEYPHLEYLTQNRVHFVNIEIGHEALKRDKGAVLISAHMANWEVSPLHFYDQLHDDISMTYRPPNNPYTDWLLQKFRGKDGRIQLLPKSRKGGQSMMQVLRRKAVLGILIDQKYNEGEAVPFFGHDAMTNPVFAKLAKKYEAPLLPISFKRLAGAHFEIRYHPEIKTEGRSEYEIMLEAQNIIEGWIRQSPSQWLWLHRRWGK